jgi:hypothetical protein
MEATRGGHKLSAAATGLSGADQGIDPWVIPCPFTRGMVVKVIIKDAGFISMG